MTPQVFVPSVAARVERITSSGGLTFVTGGSESSAMSSTSASSRAQQFVSRRCGATPNHALQRTAPSPSVRAFGFVGRPPCAPPAPPGLSLSLGRSAGDEMTAPSTILGVSASLALCVSSGRRSGGLVPAIVLGRAGLPNKRRGQETQRRRGRAGDFQGTDILKAEPSSSSERAGCPLIASGRLRWRVTEQRRSAGGE